VYSLHQQPGITDYVPPQNTAVCTNWEADTNSAHSSPSLVL